MTLPFTILHLLKPDRWIKVMSTGIRVECMGHEAQLWQELQAARLELEHLKARVAELEVNRDV